MSDEEILNALKNELAVSFVFADVDILMEKCENVLEEVKQNVTDGSDLQLRNFHVQRDAIMKYQKEKECELLKQEKMLIDKTAEIDCRSESLKKEINDIQQQLIQIKSTIAVKQKTLQSMELEEMMWLKEHDENIQSLEGARKSIANAIAWYNRFLGIEIKTDSADSHRFYIEFRLDGAKKADYKIPVMENNNGYVFPDGSVASTPSELLICVCNERKKFMQSIF